MLGRLRLGTLSAPLIALALVATACGGDGEPADEVATLQSTEAPGQTTTVVALSPDEALLEFSACMRDNGVDLPDIAIGPDGAPLLDPGLADDLDIRSPEFTTAFTTCISILAASGAFQQTRDPAEVAQRRDQLVGFSACMRSEGIGDFPDPSFTGFLPYPLGVFADIGDPAFDAAVETCQEGIAFDGFGDS